MEEVQNKKKQWKEECSFFVCVYVSIHGYVCVRMYDYHNMDWFIMNMY